MPSDPIQLMALWSQFNFSAPIDSFSKAPEDNKSNKQKWRNKFGRGQLLQRLKLLYGFHPREGFGVQLKKSMFWVLHNHINREDEKQKFPVNMSSGLNFIFVDMLLRRGARTDVRCNEGMLPLNSVLQLFWARE
ncbi:hypothetical protein O6P43_005207 [Quillaja saponaria]|uniref:Uncharacterized protein n=1 Tax=Quillaja saponaria TaxID=32244 RepID=A0AAD7Q5G3_QUISA|nr:hypothetical protein O6P43_005207 [Quillaja saponaria]